MLSQIQPAAAEGFDVRSIPTLPVFVHIVTLINRRTGDEQAIEVVTTSDSFCEVLRETAHQKAMRKLFGYEIFEALPLSTPF